VATVARNGKRKLLKYHPGSFAQLANGVTSCENYLKLSMDARALMQDANAMFVGNNNGNICLAYKVMHSKGWSKRRLMNARHELEHYGFIEKTVEGGSHKATLYALAWINVQRCDGKHDAPPTVEPSMAYLKERDQWVSPKRAAPYPRRHETI
jgi:hypothetical protein